MGFHMMPSLRYWKRSACYPLSYPAANLAATPDLSKILTFRSSLRGHNKPSFVLHHHLQAALDCTSTISLQAIPTTHKYFCFVGCNQFLNCSQCIRQFIVSFRLCLQPSCFYRHIKFSSLQWRWHMDSKQIHI